MNRRLEYVCVLALLLLAAVLRVQDLTQLPPGFNNHELATIRITETVRQGDVAVYYQIAGTPGRAGLYGIGNMLSTELTGGGLLGYRLFPLAGASFALALLYALARRLFGVPVALIALGIMSVNLRAILLARSATAESWMPAYVLLTLLLLAAAFNLRREVRFHTPNTLHFALLALLLGGSGYLHYSGLVLGPLAALFFIHLMITNQPLSRRVWSASFFLLVLATIVAIPYLVSTGRHPELSEPYIAWTERPQNALDAIDGALHAIGGLMWRGDLDITNNLPRTPLLGPVLSVLLILGVVEAVRRWREPGYTLMLLALAAGLLTDTWVEVESTFSANLVLLPALYILPGIGALVVWRALRTREIDNAAAVVTAGALLILAVNVLVVRERLFDDWTHHRDLRAAYHTNLGYLAAYLDRTPDDLPVSLCAARLNEPREVGLTPRQMLNLMLHRQDLPLRHSDCRGGLVLINAGAPMRFAFADVRDREQMPPELRDWLNEGVPIPVDGLRAGSVLYLNVEQRVRDQGGYWASFSNTYYMPTETGELVPVQLPVQLEQNLTFAGYDPRALEGIRVAGGNPVVLVTYWRVDGELPRHLGIFAHLLAYPETGPRVPLLEPWSEANAIDVLPSELENRDIFIQVSYLWLRDNLTPDTYVLTVGAYVDTVTILDNHLDVLDPANDFQPHGDRLLLGNIVVEAAPETPDSESDASSDALPPAPADEAAGFIESLDELNETWFNGGE